MISKKIIVGICLLFSLVSLLNCNSKKEKETLWQPLFNGHSLEGWIEKGFPEDTKKGFWTVKDSMIMANSLGDTIHEYSWLATKPEFENFELKLKFQVFEAAKGNSGIQIMSRYDDTEYWLDGPQIDIAPKEPWRSGMMWDETRGNFTWIYPALDAPNWVKPEMALNPVHIKYSDSIEQWNDMRILVKDLKIKSWINNTLVTDYDGNGILNDSIHQHYNVGQKGAIALQIHRKDEVKINFKDIYIKTE